MNTSSRSVNGLGSSVNPLGGEELCVMPPSIPAIAQTSLQSVLGFEMNAMASAKALPAISNVLKAVKKVVFNNDEPGKRHDKGIYEVENRDTGRDEMIEVRRNKGKMPFRQRTVVQEEQEAQKRNGTESVGVLLDEVAGIDEVVPILMDGIRNNVTEVVFNANLISVDPLAEPLVE
ncbi:unnamed protein product [Ilex paraguariensis]|uniref:Uncharacterized protein n=1 Tax=Ilex paraguariensis TaxID=185542 RepID=A0ABC8V5E8_9AQUA